MRIRLHVPNFVEVSDDFQWEYEAPDQAALLELPPIKQWATGPHFFRFSQDDGYLIAETKHGHEWWVVGQMIDGALDLPAWKIP